MGRVTTVKTDVLIAIDPGNLAGVAVFDGGRLKTAMLVRRDRDKNMVRWREQLSLISISDKPAIVVVEIPERRGAHSNVSVNNLLKLAFTAGRLVGETRIEHVVTATPREWKGQRPKDIDNAFVMRLLCDQERRIVAASGATDAQMNNVIDAVGIGLWALGRR